MQKLKIIIISILLAISGTTLAQEQPVPAAEKPALQQITEKARGLIDYALSLTGVPYRFGGSNPETGLDCSGLVKTVFRDAAGMSLPHNALAISLVGDRINAQELKPGDLVFFKTMRRAFTHVGIYLGENKFVHAATRGGEVMISDLKDKYWAKRFNGARRIDLPQPGVPAPGLSAPE